MTPALAPVFEVLEAGRREGIAPALAAVVRRGGAVVHESAHGEAGVGPDAVFDVASLTKVMATTTLTAQLLDTRALSLDEPVAARLAGFEAGGKAAVTVRHLLAHSSGLPAWRPYFELAMADPVAGAAFRAPPSRPSGERLAAALVRGRALVSAAALAEPLEAAPGTRGLYCDPGFIALGLLVESVAGAPLSRLAEERVLRPLGLRSTFFLDATDPEQTAARAAGHTIVPTGWSARRSEVVQGTVNDDNAWAMGGAAGHAGIFSTAGDVARFGEAWLDALGGRGGVVGSATAKELARRDATPGSDRALGWDRPSAGGSSIGSRLGRGPRGAIGHLGFTGSSLWVDLDAGLVCALLTNHVHPSGISDKARMRSFRQRFHDAVAEAVGVG